MPECPEPEIECQTITRERGCADTDYSVALREWEARRDAWLAEDPERDPEDFPEEEPEKPADYDDYTYGCFLPFEEPTGEPTDEIPTLYRRMKAEQVIESDGTAKRYLSTDTGFPSVETLWVWTGGEGDGSWTSNTTLARKGTEPGDPDYYCETDSDSGIGEPWAFDWQPADLPNPAWICESNTRTEIMEVLEYSEAGTASALNGCPLSDPGGFAEKDEYEAEATKTTKWVETLSLPLTKSDLLTSVLGDLPTEWPEDETPGTECVAESTVSWPTVADAPDPWPDCESSSLPATVSASASVAMLRYRWTVPAEHEGTYFKIEWDEIFFPADYDPDDPESPQPTLEPKSWEWTGGDRESPWSLPISPPEGELGRMELANVRWICYRSPYGTKPTYSDEFARYTPPA